MLCLRIFYCYFFDDPVWTWRWKELYHLHPIRLPCFWFCFGFFYYYFIKVLSLLLLSSNSLGWRNYCHDEGIWFRILSQGRDKKHPTERRESWTKSRAVRFRLIPTPQTVQTVAGSPGWWSLSHFFRIGHLFLYYSLKSKIKSRFGRFIYILAPLESIIRERQN